MNGLAKRVLQPELMDDPSLDSQQHRQALRGLARSHRVIRTATRLWKNISKLAAGEMPAGLTVMDVGCGDGFLLRQIFKIAKRRSIEIKLIGCDFSRTALGFAHQASQAENIPIELHAADILIDPLPPADVIINSLFLHHFADQQVVEILKKFDAAATTAVIVEDLQRSWWGLGVCWIATRLLTRSKIVHIDGQLSVRAAFSTDEISQILNQAGLRHANVSTHWPARYLISWSKNQTVGQT